MRTPETCLVRSKGANEISRSLASLKYHENDVHLNANIEQSLMRSRGFSIVSFPKLGAARFCFNRKGRKVDVGTKFNLSATDRCRFLPIFCGHFPSAVIFILNKIFLAGRLRDYFLTNMFLKCINFI